MCSITQPMCCIGVEEGNSEERESWHVSFPEEAPSNLAPEQGSKSFLLAQSQVASCLWGCSAPGHTRSSAPRAPWTGQTWPGVTVKPCSRGVWGHGTLLPPGSGVRLRESFMTSWKQSPEGRSHSGARIWMSGQFGFWVGTSGCGHRYMAGNGLDLQGEGKEHTRGQMYAVDCLCVVKCLCGGGYRSGSSYTCGSTCVACWSARETPW